MSLQPVPHPAASEQLMILQPVTHFAGGRGHQGLAHFRGRQISLGHRVQGQHLHLVHQHGRLEAVDLRTSKP